MVVLYSRKYVKLHRGCYFFTRSEWIFYFLSKQKEKVIYECHQLSKIKKILIQSSIKQKIQKLFLSILLLLKTRF